MNKILVSGLLVALSFPLTEAEACGNGGFYVGVNAGVGFTQAKYRNSVAEQEDVWDLAGKEVQVYTKSGKQYYKADDLADGETNVTGRSLKKNKTKFLAELSLGWDHRYNDVMFGIDFNFGMKFGKSKKTAKGLAISENYNAEVATSATADGWSPTGGAPVANTQIVEITADKPFYDSEANIPRK